MQDEYVASTVGRAIAPAAEGNKTHGSYDQT